MMKDKLDVVKSIGVCKYLSLVSVQCIVMICFFKTGELP